MTPNSPIEDEQLKQANVIAAQIQQMDDMCVPYKTAEELRPRWELLQKMKALGYQLDWGAWVRGGRKKWSAKPLPTDNGIGPIGTINVKAY